MQVCMIYYPSETGSGWADALLNLLSYSKRETSCVSTELCVDSFFCFFRSESAARHYSDGVS